MTPRQLRLAEKAYIKNKEVAAEEYQIQFKNTQDLAITQAWLTANWGKAKRMPSLKSVLKTEKKKKVMNSKEMLAQVKILNQMLGGEVIDGTKE